jgi:transcriptional regulator with XRE-family HTH domain
MADKEIDARVLARRLGRRIRMLRAGRGWSQEVLADLAGVHRNYIGHAERGELNISIAQLDKIARALEVGMGELVEG